MEWIKASKYVKLTDNCQNTAVAIGMYPINDPLLSFMKDDSKIILLRGGRGGGKSNTIALRLIAEARTEKYFKCYFGRKVLDRVRGSMHAELVKAIRQMKLEDEFYFSDQPNGSLTILHKKTLNSFHAFGGDNAQSMKSISDPTHIWCDELDQFNETDFRALFPTLRTLRGKNIFIGSFNSYEVLKSHWVVRLFYPDIYDGLEKYDYDILDGVKINKYLVNYTDNSFINQEEYEKQLRIAAGGDADLFEGLARGEWGLDKKGNEWYHAYKYGKHVASVPFLPGKAVHLTYDFNLVPYMTLVCCQVNETADEFQIRIFKEYCFKPPLNTTEDVTSQFLVDHFGKFADLFYYGDAQGTRGVEGFGHTFTRFDPVREVLKSYLGHASNRTTRRNIGVNKRRDLINRILSGNLTIGNKKVSIIIDQSCKETIKDFQLLKIGVDGKLKEKEKDPVTGASYEKLAHCFVGSTMISTKDGEKRIDDVKVGDLVLTRNGYKPVVKVFDNGIRKVNKYSLNDVEVVCTENHRILTQRGFIPVSSIVPGDVVTIKTQLLPKYLKQKNTVLMNVKLNSVTVEPLPESRAYDLRVNETPEYFANGVLVHNCSDATDYFICYILEKFIP